MLTSRISSSSLNSQTYFPSSSTLDTLLEMVRLLGESGIVKLLRLKGSPFENPASRLYFPWIWRFHSAFWIWLSPRYLQLRDMPSPRTAVTLLEMTRVSSSPEAVTQSDRMIGKTKRSGVPLNKHLQTQNRPAAIGAGFSPERRIIACQHLWNPDGWVAICWEDVLHPLLKAANN